MYYEKLVTRLFSGWKILKEDWVKNTLTLQKTSSEIDLNINEELLLPFKASNCKLNAKGEGRGDDYNYAIITLTFCDVEYPSQPE